jgi:hypothetical protein
MRPVYRPWLLSGSPGRLGETLAGLPPQSRRRGGREAWGLRGLLTGRLRAEPGVLPGRLRPAVIELLDELMTGTAAGTLSGVWLKD